MGEPAIQSLKPILVLNIILASFFFAGGYALAYFTAPRETVIIREPIVYNNTIVYNYTIPIENHTVIVINDTRIINNTVVINGTPTYLIGVPAMNFTVTMSFQAIMRNISLIFASASGRFYYVDIQLWYYGDYNASELHNVSLTLSVEECDTRIYTSAILSVHGYLISGAWYYMEYFQNGAHATAGFFDMTDIVEVIVETYTQTRGVGFFYQVEYVFLR